jgi:hypothetical protein
MLVVSVVPYSKGKLRRKTISHLKRVNASSAILELSSEKYMTISLSDV